jgi:argininosuccinate lyase
LTLDELREASAAFDETALEALTIESVVAHRTSEGGTAPSRIAEQLAAAEHLLQADREALG